MCVFLRASWLFILIMLSFVALGCQIGGWSDWESVGGDDDADDDNASDDDASPCEVTLAQWEDLAESCPMQLPPSEDGHLWTGEELYELCNSCLVGCLQNFPACSTHFNQCSAGCDL